MDIARRRGTLAELAKQLEAPALERGPAEWESLSEVRDELGDLNGALEAARHAQSRQPRDVEIGRRVAALLDRLGREDEVTAELAALAHLAPSDPRFTIDLIERQFRTATKEEARAELDRAIARFANNPPALGQLADLAGRWSENRRALDAWQRLLRLSPHDEMAILGLGEVQFQAHRKDAAIHTWQALRSGRSSKADGSARLAEVLMEHDLLDEATAEVEQAEALEPKEPRHRRLMAQILERQRRPDAAIAEWERVMAMNVGPGARGGAARGALAHPRHPRPRRPRAPRGQDRQAARRGRASTPSAARPRCSWPRPSCAATRSPARSTRCAPPSPAIARTPPAAAMPATTRRPR